MTDKTIRERLFSGINGCSDHGCVVLGKQNGMGTNGGCRCIVNMGRGELQILQSRITAIADLYASKEQDR